MNMFKPAKANNIEDYFKSAEPERAKILHTIDKLIKETAPNLKPHFAYNMLGYGSFPYVNYKKENITWPVIALANQKNYLSLYVCAVKDGEYLAEKYQKELGKVSVGKSCVRFKKIEDLDLDGIKKLIKLAAQYPGLK